MGPPVASILFAVIMIQAFILFPAAMAGYPHITVPMGRVFELPVGFRLCLAHTGDGYH